jgi:hypothetical protein
MNLTHMADDMLLRIVERDRAGWYRANSPCARAAEAALAELERRGATETQEAAQVPREAYDED